MRNKTNVLTITITRDELAALLMQSNGDDTARLKDVDALLSAYQDAYHARTGEWLDQSVDADEVIRRLSGYLASDDDVQAKG